MSYKIILTIPIEKKTKLYSESEKGKGKKTPTLFDARRFQMYLKKGEFEKAKELLSKYKRIEARLCEHGEDYGCKHDKFDQWLECSDRCKKVIDMAIVSGNLEIVKLLYSKACDLRRKGKDWLGIKMNFKRVLYNSVAHFGIKNGHFEIVKFFLNKGLNPNFKFSFIQNAHQTLLYNAIEYKQKKIAEYIINNGYKITEAAAEDIKECIYSNDMKTMELLLSKGAKPRYIDMEIACKEGNLEAVKLMAQHGFDVNMVNTDRRFRGFSRTILCFLAKDHFSKKDEKLQIMEYLLKECKARPDICNRRNETPLMLVVKKITNDRAFEKIKLLVDYGADMRVKVIDWYGDRTENSIYNKVLRIYEKNKSEYENKKRSNKKEDNWYLEFAKDRHKKTKKIFKYMEAKNKKLFKKVY